VTTTDIWSVYPLTLTVDRLVGGVPKHPAIVQRWQEANWPASETKLQEGDPATVDEAAALTVEALGDQAFDPEEKMAGIWTGFYQLPSGELAIGARQVKAMLKESANIVKTLVPVKGKVIPLRAKLAERVFVHPQPYISLGVMAPSGTIERPIHVMTAQGPRTALKRTDYVDDVKVLVELQVLNDGLITRDLLTLILEHASENGLGTDRSQGMGVFTYELG
jgi:hypothetical protein